MTVDSVLTRAEIYRALYKNSNRYSRTNQDLLIGEDWDSLHKSMLQNINFFNKSEYIPVTVDEINTIRKIYELDFNYVTFLCDFFRGEDVENVDARLIDSLCREMESEIERQEAERTLNEVETGRAVIRTNSIETMSEDYARRLYEQFSSCRPLTEVSEITVTDENMTNVRGTWFVT